jgi:RND family efflux transporter MFP subunit
VAIFQRGVLCAVGWGAVSLLSACTPAEPPLEPIRSVKLITVGVTALEAEPEYAGDVKARVESQLGFRVGGKLVRRDVRLGQRVQAGDVLAQLDAQDFQLASEQARAQVAAATTQRDLAAADYERFATLKDQNFISGAELERRASTLKAAQAALDQAKAQSATQSNQTTYTRLVADVSGVVTSVDAEPGQVVTAGQPIVRIAQDGARDAVFSVPENTLAQLKVGQTVWVRGWASTNPAVADTATHSHQVQGRLRELAASADPVTRTYTVKVAIDAELSPPLGATVYATPQALSHAGQPAIKVPTTALRQDGQATAVWVYDPVTSTVRSQTVRVATADGNDAVIASGLQPGMQIVATGVHVLSPGQKVVIYRQKMALPFDDIEKNAIKNDVEKAVEVPAASVAVPSSVLAPLVSQPVKTNSAGVKP